MRRPARLGRHPLAICLAAAVVAASGCGNVAVRPEEPIGAASLKPTREDTHAGLVGIARGFDVKAYRAVVIERFIVSDKDLSEEDDKKLAQTMPGYLQSQLVERLRATGLFERVVNQGEPGRPTEETKALRLHGEITALSGGSRALRFWISFGAGRSKVQIETRFQDAETGATVLVTADRRVGALSEAMSLDYGGSNEALVTQTLNDMARDLARFLVRLSRGEAPRKE